MLHIEAVTPENLTLLVGVCFRRYERRVDYAWVMNKFRRIFSENKIGFLEVFVTDQDIALIDSVKEHVRNRNTFHAIDTLIINFKQTRESFFQCLQKMKDTTLSKANSKMHGFN